MIPTILLFAGNLHLKDKKFEKAFKCFSDIMKRNKNIALKLITGGKESSHSSTYFANLFKKPTKVKAKFYNFKQALKAISSPKDINEIEKLINTTFPTSSYSYLNKKMLEEQKIRQKEIKEIEEEKDFADIHKHHEEIQDKAAEYQKKNGETHEQEAKEVSLKGTSYNNSSDNEKSIFKL